MLSHQLKSAGNFRIRRNPCLAEWTPPRRHLGEKQNICCLSFQEYNGACM